jgi:hemoglobin
MRYALGSLEVIEMARSMFERYGGFAKINRIVMSFYDKMTTSPITKKYFENTNMRKLIDHQTKFVASMMGGPTSFTNEHLARVHARLGITNTAFDEAVDLLTETLEDFDVEDVDVKTVENEVMSRKIHIVTKG